MYYLWIGLGGFAGANARYLVNVWAVNRWGAYFPYGTLVVNVSGSFLIAFFLALAGGRFSLSTEVRLLVAVGFLGSFTTFSTFSYETFSLAVSGRWGMAILNFAGETLLGLLAVALGLWLAYWLEQAAL